MTLEGVVVGACEVPVSDGSRGSARDVRASAALARSAPLSASKSVEKIPLLGAGRELGVRSGSSGRVMGYSRALVTNLVLLGTLAVAAVVGVSVREFSGVAQLDPGVETHLASLGAAGAKLGSHRSGVTGSATDIPDRPTALEAFNPFADARGLKLDPRHLPELTPAGLAKSQKATMMVDQVNAEWLRSSADAAREDTDEFNSMSTSRDARDARDEMESSIRPSSRASSRVRSAGGVRDRRREAEYDAYDDSSYSDDSYRPVRTERPHVSARRAYDDSRDAQGARTPSGGGVILGGGAKRRKKFVPTSQRVSNLRNEIDWLDEDSYSYDDDFAIHDSRDFDVPLPKPSHETKTRMRGSGGGLGAFRSGDSPMRVADDEFSFDPDPELTARLQLAKQHKRGAYRGMPVTQAAAMGLRRRSCLLKRSVTDTQAQAVLDYACDPGNGELSSPMSCAPISKGGRAFVPNTKRDHAAWAITQFFNKRNAEVDSFPQRDCHFAGVATLNVPGNYYLTVDGGLTRMNHYTDSLSKKIAVPEEGLVFSNSEPITGVLTDTVTNGWSETLVLPDAALEEGGIDVSIDLRTNRVVRKRTGPNTTFKFWVGAAKGTGSQCMMDVAVTYDFDGDGVVDREERYEPQGVPEEPDLLPVESKVLGKSLKIRGSDFWDGVSNAVVTLNVQSKNCPGAVNVWESAEMYPSFLTVPYTE